MFRQRVLSGFQPGYCFHQFIRSCLATISVCILGIRCFSGQVRDRPYFSSEGSILRLRAATYHHLAKWKSPHGLYTPFHFCRLRGGVQGLAPINRVQEIDKRSKRQIRVEKGRMVKEMKNKFKKSQRKKAQRERRGAARAIRKERQSSQDISSKNETVPPSRNRVRSAPARGAGWRCSEEDSEAIILDDLGNRIPLRPDKGLDWISGGRQATPAKGGIGRLQEVCKSADVAPYVDAEGNVRWLDKRSDAEKARDRRLCAAVEAEKLAHTRTSRSAPAQSPPSRSPDSLGPTSVKADGGGGRVGTIKQRPFDSSARQKRKTAEKESRDRNHADDGFDDGFKGRMPEETRHKSIKSKQHDKPQHGNDSSGRKNSGSMADIRMRHRSHGRLQQEVLRLEQEVTAARRRIGKLLLQRPEMHAPDSADSGDVSVAQTLMSAEGARGSKVLRKRRGADAGEGEEDTYEDAMPRKKRKPESSSLRSSGDQASPSRSSKFDSTTSDGQRGAKSGSDVSNPLKHDKLRQKLSDSSASKLTNEQARAAKTGSKESPGEPLIGAAAVHKPREANATRMAATRKGGEEERDPIARFMAAVRRRKGAAPKIPWNTSAELAGADNTVANLSGSPPSGRWSTPVVQPPDAGTAEEDSSSVPTFAEQMGRPDPDGWFSGGAKAGEGRGTVLVRRRGRLPEDSSEACLPGETVPVEVVGCVGRSVTLQEIFPNQFSEADEAEALKVDGIEQPYDPSSPPIAKSEIAASGSALQRRGNEVNSPVKEHPPPPRRVHGATVGAGGIFYPVMGHNARCVDDIVAVIDASGGDTGASNAQTKVAEAHLRLNLTAALSAAQEVFGLNGVRMAARSEDAVKGSQPKLPRVYLERGSHRSEDILWVTSRPIELVAAIGAVIASHIWLAPPFNTASQSDFDAKATAPTVTTGGPLDGKRAVTSRTGLDALGRANSVTVKKEYSAVEALMAPLVTVGGAGWMFESCRVQTARRDAVAVIQAATLRARLCHFGGFSNWNDLTATAGVGLLVKDSGRAQLFKSQISDCRVGIKAEGWSVVEAGITTLQRSAHGVAVSGRGDVSLRRVTLKAHRIAAFSAVADTLLRPAPAPATSGPMRMCASGPRGQARDSAVSGTRLRLLAVRVDGDSWAGPNRPAVVEERVEEWGPDSDCIVEWPLGLDSKS